MPHTYYIRLSKSYLNSSNIYDSLLTVYDTCSGRRKREFCTDTFRLTIRESRARDVYTIIDDVTTPYEPLYVSTHPLSIKRADWRKLHGMFKARDAKAWLREFPVEFPVRVCAFNVLLINMFLDIVARIESRCVIKAKHVLFVW